MSSLQKTIKKDRSWIKIIRKYNSPDVLKSWMQILNSVIPYFALWVLMFFSLKYSYLLTLLLAIPAAGFMTRIFIIFHDCGHGSFFKSPKLSFIIGNILGIMMYTPYSRWHLQHSLHHQTSGNLDDSGIGDVITLTVDEYRNKSKFEQLKYKIYRHPVTILLIAPLLIFLVLYRIPVKEFPAKVRMNTHFTNVAIIIMVYTLSSILGFKNFLMIQIPIMLVGFTAGVWLFYVQHQYEDVLWERREDWDHKTASLNGSSYLKLPKILQWFSGNIGFHHIHHLCSTIPNYKLEQCHNENPEFQVQKPLTFTAALQTFKYRLWDEDNRKLISFKEYYERDK